ncbi:hypothetical protein D6C80_00475 [Aureobasidium pullulans]|nr:hypothetical protein D6C80_00475 [Aureobasidium pullulans]
MLSRANSDPALRLRRAKSSSSTSHKAFDASSISTEPRYAEVAAVEAYTRAYRHSQDDRPQRRRSRRSEGSHFDDNRRKSTQRTERPERPALVHGPATAPAAIPATIPARAPTRLSLLPDTPYRFALEASNDPTITDVSESRHSTASRRQTRDFQTDDEIKTAAWDAYLQGFGKKEVRERKSFAAPLKKRFTKSPAPAPSIQYDTSVPPYNFVEEADDIFSTAPPIEIKPEDKLDGPSKLKKQRTVSESLKGKFKRLLSRPKRVQSHFPAQHVEARNLHFDVYKTNDDSFSAGPDFGVSLPRSPFSSLGASSGAQSRITSWSNSTTSRPGKRLPSIEETSASAALATTLEEPCGTFIGRALRLPLRRPSQSSLRRKSEDSKHLYDALQKRINAPEVPTIVVEEDTSPPQTALYNDSPSMSPLAETIRMVTPDPAVPESPTRPPPSPPHQVTRKSSWWSIAPSIRSKKRRAAEPAAPSKEQIAARMERSDNRWQAALEDGSPVVSRALNYCMKGDNPYELRPLENVNNTSLPVAIRHESYDAAAPTFTNGADLHDIRQQVISPSIYSRSVSPDAGTFITITGREVKRYPLESPPRPLNGPTIYAPKPSNEWRAWFSKEIEDFTMTPVPTAECVPAGPNYLQENINPHDSRESLQEGSPVLQVAKSRPQLRSRTSSIMNDRYPMIETGRSSSRTSGRRTNPSSASSTGQRSASDQRSASGSGLSVAENASSKGSQLVDNDQSTLASLSLRERQSTSALVRKKSSLATRAARHGYSPSSSEIDSAGREDPVKDPVKAPKSALDLRVMYRNNRNLEASSLNIRRRAIAPTLFDDHTLRRISEGPYAADSKENTAPSKASGMIDGITIPPFYTPTQGSPKVKGSSPGQKMVDDFLSSRKSQMVANSPPAFI